MTLLLEYIGGPGNVETFSRDKIVRGSCQYGTCLLPPMQVSLILAVHFSLVIIFSALNNLALFCLCNKHNEFASCDLWTWLKSHSQVANCPLEAKVVLVKLQGNSISVSVSVKNPGCSNLQCGKGVQDIFFLARLIWPHLLHGHIHEFKHF